MTDEREGMLRDVRDFCAKVQADQRAYRLREVSRPWLPQHTTASMIGWECVRRICYERLMPWAKQELDPVLASIFFEGRLHEQQVLAELDRLGIRWRNKQGFFVDERLDLSGSEDVEVDIYAYLKIPGSLWVPAEIKGLRATPGEEDGEDMAESRPLMRRYFAQCQTYAFLAGVPVVLLVAKSKQTGLWTPIPVELDLGAMEGLLRKAERVRDAVRAYRAAFETVMPYRQEGPPREPADDPSLPTDTATRRAAHLWSDALAAAEPHLPERLQNRSECPSCPFRATCNPSQAPVEPALIAVDEELIEDLDLVMATRATYRTYNRTWEKLKARFELTAGERFVAGDFEILWRPHGTGRRLVVQRLAKEGA